MTDPIPPGDEGPVDPPPDPPPPAPWSLPPLEYCGDGTLYWHFGLRKPVWSDATAGVWRDALGQPITE